MYGKLLPSSGEEFFGLEEGGEGAKLGRGRFGQSGTDLRGGGEQQLRQTLGLTPLLSLRV